MNRDQINILDKFNTISTEITASLYIIHFSFKIIRILCYLNMLFFTQNFISMIFAKKMGRSIDFPNASQLINAIFFTSSIVLIVWFDTRIAQSLHAASEVSQIEYERLLLKNYQANIDFKFQYLFSIQITGLIVQVLAVIQFSQKIGPLIKIV